ncbi:MAG: hypothetical protein ACT4PV_08685 [Planctomycetaceae bacterium]
MSAELSEYRDRGARALVLLHEAHLRSFVALWKRARAAGLVLPACADPDYASLETVLRHVLRAARGYMTWMCESLGLQDPRIAEAPSVAEVAGAADGYVDHLLARWRTPLAGVPEERFGTPEYRSRWGVSYCIDAMLEHAVMHPIRHSFQLQSLLAAQGLGA